jgi:hypothetical protein
VRRLRSQGPTRPLTATGPVTANWPAPSDAKTTRRRRGGWFAAALALIAAAAVGVVVALSAGDSGSDTKPKPRPTASAPVSVPRSGDPATQARQLSEFLRAQSRPQPSAQQP